MSQCPNGWVLLWSDYDPDTDTANEYDMVYTVVHKGYIESGNKTFFIIPVMHNSSAAPGPHTVKTLYIYDDRLMGHDSNHGDYYNARDSVLRRVLSF